MTAEADWRPLDPDEDAAQREALAGMIGPGQRVVDLGCGDGRTALDLASRGVRVLAIDNDPGALRRCAGVDGVETREADVLDVDAELGFAGDPADAALCLGHTFMEFHGVLEAASLLRRLRAVVAPGGWFAIDASCVRLWDDVADGSWATGVSEDGRWQLIWLPDDALFVLREGDRVDPENWAPGPGERRLRLWSLGALTLLAEASGWAAPAEDDSGTLLIFRRPDDRNPPPSAR